LAGAERRDCGGERDAAIVWRLVRLHREPKELKGSFAGRHDRGVGLALMTDENVKSKRSSDLDFI